MADLADQMEQNRIKRLKTARACDQCRRVRSRCDIQNTNTAPTSPDESICERCRRLNLECTFILPIGETRGKRIPLKGNLDHNSPSRESATTEGSPSSAEAYTDPIEKFKTFITTNLPIISPRDLTHDSSILLHCCARLLGTLCTETASDCAVEKLKASLEAYMLSKSPFKTPTVQNVQALVLLAVVVEDKGYGLKFMTAVRMACSLGWNIQQPDISSNSSTTDDAEDSAYTQYLWWTLVTLDIWLYLYSGIPLLINYRDFNVPVPLPPHAPSFFASLTSLSEVLRFKIRPSSFSQRVPGSTPYNSLQAWQTTYLSSIIGTGGLLEAVIDALHGAVVALFVLSPEGDAVPSDAEVWLMKAVKGGFEGVFGRVKGLKWARGICVLGLFRLERWGGSKSWEDTVEKNILDKIRSLEESGVGWELVWRMEEILG
ncbi:hypothetical protein DFP73DRAFT_537476 [Morchella snyderi]|nr:hypothetical protein DFP73DRAFT_537476 [Morchella snyderi]